MEYFYFYRIAACLLMLGFLGHTLGGMLATAKRGVKSGAEADEVLAKMKSVRFTWRGGNCSWFGFWLGNGLGVSALLIPVIAVVWTLGGLSPEQFQIFKPIAWATFVGLAALTALGFKYFVPRIGIVFGLIAVLVGIGNFLAV